MCEPVSIAMAATQMVQATVGYMGQKAQADAQTAMYEQNRSNALTAYADDIEASNLNAMANSEAATQRRMEAKDEALFNASAARVSAGERGVGGYSAAALERDLMGQAGRQVAAINRNAELDDQRYRTQTRGARNAATSRINSMSPGTQPSLIAFGAQLGQAALNGYTMNQQQTLYKKQIGAMK